MIFFGAGVSCEFTLFVEAVMGEKKEYSKDYWNGYMHGCGERLNPFRWFHRTFLQKKLPYSPS